MHSLIDLTASDEQHYSQAVQEASFMGIRQATMATPHTRPVKVERILKIVEKVAESNRKVLIFTYYLDVLRVLTEALGKRVIGIVAGSLSLDKRQELIDALDTASSGTGLSQQNANDYVLRE